MSNMIHATITLPDVTEKYVIVIMMVVLTELVVVVVVMRLVMVIINVVVFSLGCGNLEQTQSLLIGIWSWILQLRL